MRLGRLAATILTIGLTVPANAEILYATYRGTIFNGTDGRGLFGVKGTSLAGLPFIAVFRINENNPQYSYRYDFEGGFAIQKVSYIDPFLNAYLSVNGKRSYLGENYSEEIQARYGFGVAQVEHYVVFNNQIGSLMTERTLDLIISSDIVTSVPENGYTAPYFFKASIPNLGGGEFRSFTYDDISREYIGTDLGLYPESLSIRSVIPEPSTWITMILGLSTVGCSIRRRSSRAVIASKT